MDAEAKAVFRNYHQLLDRVKKLLLLITKLSEQNREFKRKLQQLDEKITSQSMNEETLTIKEELKKLKLENKILKEKEAKIKTKIDRLAVKLEKIHL